MYQFNLKTKEDLKHFLSHTDKEITVVRFTAKWCNPCTKLNFYMSEILNEFKNYEFNYLVIDVDVSRELYSFFKRYKMVNGIPCLLFYIKKYFNEETYYVPQHSITGLQPTLIRNDLEKILKNNIKF